MKLTATNYLVCCLSLALVIVAGIGAFNYWVDPCGIYHYGVSWDWTRSRPEILETELIFKARAIETANADVLLMGSSRVAEGLDPLGPSAPPHTYNLGMPQTGMYEAWRYLQHVCSVHVPTTVVLGVEYAWAKPERPEADFYSEDRLLVQPNGQPTPALTVDFADLTSTLYSWSMTQLSAKTLQEPQDPPMKFKAGYEADGPKIIDHLDLAANVLKATNDWVGRLNPGPFRDANGRTPQMNSYRRILALCRDKNIHLIVFTHPVHALTLDKETRSWRDYSSWMYTLLADINATRGLKAEVWDFSGYNSISTEPLPQPGDTYSHMRYYWEGSHYRKIVGDLVLQRIFTGTGPDSFGRIVTLATLDEDLQRLLDEKTAWHERGQAVAIDFASPQVEKN